MALQSGDKPDLLATSGESLRIWKINENSEVTLEANLKNVCVKQRRTTTSLRP